VNTDLKPIAVSVEDLTFAAIVGSRTVLNVQNTVEAAAVNQNRIIGG